MGSGQCRCRVVLLFRDLSVVISVIMLPRSTECVECLKWRGGSPNSSLQSNQIKQSLEYSLGIR